MLKDKKVAFILVFLLSMLLGLQLGRGASVSAQTAGFIEYQYDGLHKVGIFIYKSGNGVALQVIPEVLLANPERIE